MYICYILKQRIIETRPRASLYVIDKTDDNDNELLAYVGNWCK